MSEPDFKAMCDAARMLDTDALALDPDKPSDLRGRARFRLFNQHVGGGPLTRHSLWDFWPIDFGLFLLLNPGPDGAPEGWREEAWRYGPVEQLLRLLLPLRRVDPPQFSAFLRDVRGKLGGRDGTLSSTLAELLLLRGINWSPGWTARRPVSLDGCPIGDLELARGAETAGVEVKNIETADGYNLQQHLFAARGLDAARSAVDGFLASGASAVVEVAGPERVLLPDGGRTLAAALAPLLSDRMPSDGALRLVERLGPGAPPGALRGRLRSRYGGKAGLKEVAGEHGNTFVLALPHRGRGLEEKARRRASEAVNRQIGRGRRAVVCFVYDFASISPIFDDAGLRRWSASLQLMHMHLGLEIKRRSTGFAACVELFLGMALVPRTPFLADLPDANWVEAFPGEGEWAIRADAVGARGAVAIRGHEAVAAHMAALAERLRAPATG